NGRKILGSVVGRIGINRRRGHVRGGVGHERVTVGLRARDRRSADRTTAAATVLDDQRLSELPPERLEYDTGDDVDRAAGTKRDDHADRLCRPALLATHARERRGGGGSGDELQMATGGIFQRRSSSRRARRVPRTLIRPFSLIAILCVHVLASIATEPRCCWRGSPRPRA